MKKRNVIIATLIGLSVLTCTPVFAADINIGSADVTTVTASVTEPVNEGGASADALLDDAFNHWLDRTCTREDKLEFAEKALLRVEKLVRRMEKKVGDAKMQSAKESAKKRADSKVSKKDKKKVSKKEHKTNQSTQTSGNANVKPGAR